MRAALITILAAVALAACGSSSSTSSATRPTPASSSTPSSGSTRTSSSTRTSGSTSTQTSTKATSSTRTRGSTGTTASQGGQTIGGCKNVPIPAPRGPYHLKPPTYTLNRAKTYTVHVTTNCGSFAFTLDVSGSPKTAASVYALVKSGFYNNLTFHRIVPQFVIQGGDPAGNGTGGPGYTVVDAPPANLRYKVGDVAMAKTASAPSGASGSQFFIVLSAAGAAQLTPVYALAGKVVSGMNVVERIGALRTNSAEYPTPPVVMSSVTVTVS